MDGVVADWNKKALTIVGYTINDPGAHYPNEDWDKIRQHRHFYRTLDVMPGAEKLVKIARRFRDELDWDLLFLTAISTGNDVPWTIWDKCQWSQEHFPDIPIHFGPYAHDKHVHCGPGDILVDDRRSNIEEWIDAGGVGIRVLNEDVEEAAHLLHLKFLHLKECNGQSFVLDPESKVD